MKARKIAVGDIGEFWYGDYKEPFVQLEGAVPGYPQGVVLRDDAGKLLCAYCGKTFDNLGGHVNFAHKMKSREYKQEVGLLAKSALVSESVRRVRIANSTRRNMEQVRAPLKKPPRPSHGNAYHWTPENLNKTGKCRAQVIAVATKEAKGGRISYSALKKYGIWPTVVDAYFGSIDGLAALLSVRKVRPRSYTKPELLAALRNLAREIGRSPSTSDLARYGLPDRSTYTKHFGGLRNAVIEAGLTPLPVDLPYGSESDQYIFDVLTRYSVGQRVETISREKGCNHARVNAILDRYGVGYGATMSAQERQEQRRRAGIIAANIAAEPVAA